MTDLIDKAEALAALQTWFAETKSFAPPSLLEAIRALPARGVGLHDLPDGVLMAAMMAVEEMDHQLNWFRHWGCDVSGWKDDADPEIRGRYADALQRVAQFRAILAALAPTDAAHVNETPKSEHDAGNVLTDAAQAPAEDAHVKGETAGQMLERLGMDGAKWAAEFRTTALRLGYSDMDEGWLIGWFCNAIMAGYDRSAAQAREAALPRSANRVDYNPDGTLDEIVTDAGVHLEHMGGKRWFLGASRSDGTEIRVWFDGKVTLIEDDAKKART